MNKVFKVIWNATSQSWVAVSELGKAKTKTKSVSLAVAGALAIAAGAANAAENFVQGTGATAAVANVDTIVIGSGASAQQGSSIALGKNAATKLNDTIAIGSGATAHSYGDIAIGFKADAHTQDDANTQQITERQSSIAIGAYTKADRYNTVAIGTYANASAVGGAAFGNNASADAQKSTALGESAKTSGTGALAAGANSNATAQAATALGDHALANKYAAAAVGWGAEADGRQATAIGAQSHATNFFSTAVGTATTASGQHSTALGAESIATGAQSTAVGKGASATNQGTVAVGHQAQANGDKSIAIGRDSRVDADNSVAIGQNNHVTAKNAFVFGSNIEDPHENSIILGANSAAVGYTSAPDTVVTNLDGSEAHTYDANKYAGHVDGSKVGNYLSIGDVGNERQIKNLAAATISAGSTDAVNGSQLFAVMERLEFVSKTGFNVGENNTAGDVTVNGNTANSTNVGLQNNINFNNGHLTVARVEAGQGKDQNDANVYYDVVTQSLATTSTTGKAAVDATKNAQANGKDFETKEQPAATNPNALTTAKNVADAINAAGFQVEGKNANGATVTSLVNPGDKVTFANGTGTVAEISSQTVNGVDTVTVKYNVDVDSETVKLEGGKVQAVTSPITKEGTAEAGNQKSATATPNALATAGDVVTAVNSARETVVSTDKTVNVTTKANAFGGTEYDLSIKTNSDTVKFTDAGVLEVATATIAPADAATGVVAPADEANGKIATAADVVNAINSAGWLVANTDGTTSVVNAGDKVVYANGTGTTATVETVDGTTTVKYSVNTDGSKTTKFDPTTNTVEVATGSISADPATGKVNPADTTNGTIATVGDVVNAINNSGFSLKGNGTEATIINPGDSLNFVNGTGTIADVKPNGDVTFNVDVDGTTIKVDEATGKIEAVTSPIMQAGPVVAGNQASVAENPDALVTAGEVANAVNSARETVTSNNKTVIVTPSKNDLGGTNYDLAVRVDGNTVQINNKGELVANAVINLQDGINTKVTKVETADGTRVYQIDANKDLVDINSIQINGPKGADGTNGKDGATLNVGKGPAGVDGLGTDGQPGTEKTRIVYQPLDKDGNPVVDAKGNPVVENVATLNDGLKFEGDDGQVVVKKLNETLTVKGNSGNKELTNGNIGVVNENGNMIVKLAKDVDLGSNGSVKAGSVTVAGKDGANVALTSNKGPSFNTAGKADGGSVDVLNVGTAGKPTRVTNVANGEISATSKDAINGSQLHAVANNINNRIDGVDKRIGKLDKRVRGVGANAAAAAALPQVYIPGKSMVAASAGGYGGASALAVGYSRASDNGRTILKLQGTVNSQGHVSGGVGVGFQW